ncbi:MAG: hypothetical protein Fur003_3170 [Candidatus Dojkabacteria bacterium]
MQIKQPEIKGSSGYEKFPEIIFEKEDLPALFPPIEINEYPYTHTDASEASQYKFEIDPESWQIVLRNNKRSYSVKTEQMITLVRYLENCTSPEICISAIYKLNPLIEQCVLEFVEAPFWNESEAANQITTLTFNYARDIDGLLTWERFYKKWINEYIVKMGNGVTDLQSRFVIRAKIVELISIISSHHGFTVDQDLDKYMSWHEGIDRFGNVFLMLQLINDIALDKDGKLGRPSVYLLKEFNLSYFATNFLSLQNDPNISDRQKDLMREGLLTLYKKLDVLRSNQGFSGEFATEMCKYFRWYRLIKRELIPVDKDNKPSLLGNL